MKALEIHWADTDSCFNSPPSAIYTFSLTDEKSLDHPVEEAWPSFYAMNIYQTNRRSHPVDLCGWLQVSIEGFCCISSLDTRRDGGTNGVKSGAIVLLQSHSKDNIVAKESILANAPSSMNTASYCFLQSSQSSNQSNLAGLQSVFGYESVMILATDPAKENKCVDIEAYYDERVSFAFASQIQCLSNGTIAFYEPSATNNSMAPGTCSGSPLFTYNLLPNDPSAETAPITTIASNVTEISVSLQPQVMINAQFIRNVENATFEIGWTSFEPNTAKVPVFKDWSEILGLGCIIIALIANVLRLYFLAAVSRIKSRERIEFAIPAGLLLYTCQRMVLMYYTGTFSSQFLNWWIGIMGWVLAITTLAQVKFTYDYFFKHIYGKFLQEKDWFRDIITPVILGLLFLVFGGGLLCAILKPIGILFSISTTFQFLQLWYFISPAWIVIVLLWSSVPIFFIFRNLRWKKVEVEGVHTKKFSFTTMSLFGFQFLLLLIFVVTLLLQVTTSALGNDRAFSSMIQVQVLLECLHSVVSIYIMELFRTYMIEKKEMQKRKKLNGPKRNFQENLTITRATTPSENRRAEEAEAARLNPDLLLLNGPGIGLVKAEAIRQRGREPTPVTMDQPTDIAPRNSIVRDALNVLVDVVRRKSHRKSISSKSPSSDQRKEHIHLEAVAEEMATTDLPTIAVLRRDTRVRIAKTNQVESPVSLDLFGGRLDADSPTIDIKLQPGRNVNDRNSNADRPSRSPNSDLVSPTLNPFDFSDDDTPTIPLRK